MVQFTRRHFAALAGLAVLAGCSSNDPLATPSTTATAAGSGASSGAKPTLVVGSQQYYSNEIIAELYAQVLEKDGYTITRQYQIGQREIYLPEIKNGKIDVFPEYGGNLLQALDKSSKAHTKDEIITALGTALGSGLRVLNAADASDQDSYTVTKALADQHGLVTIADLTKVGGTIKVGANSEFATRPYGPSGLKTVYGVTAEVTPIEDSGGPLTVKALVDGKVQAADIYTADPAIAKNNLVVLQDPKALILPQNVVPVVSQKVDEAAAAAINKVSAALTAADLQKLNARSVDEKLKSAEIATDWLKQKGLV
ncbi:ABC transporter substrate-binding protein [Propionibacteriaceae bacterium G57]|uniref:ABC transporter substrate-binding protein n=1 Tax=Aestuariimicrobium sp. G57 TaxID=3418485 RepID=UPI003DA6DCAE